MGYPQPHDFGSQVLSAASDSRRLPADEYPNLYAKCPNLSVRDHPLMEGLGFNNRGLLSGEYRARWSRPVVDLIANQR